jgi:threonine/homoserine/homoserine lactone efflux protein
MAYSEVTFSMTFLAFLTAAVLLAITPGPGITYIVARTIAGGRSEGFASCLGASIGGFLHVFAAALGLSVLVAQSAMAFTVVKYLGAAYLIFLGIRMLLKEKQTISAQVSQPRGVQRALMEGVIVEALNIKTALFFLAFLPQFVSVGAPLAPQLVLLGTICVLLNTIADVCAVLIAHRLVSVSTTKPGSRARLMGRISGATMLMLGTFLALAKREV